MGSLQGVKVGEDIVVRRPMGAPPRRQKVKAVRLKWLTTEHGLDFRIDDGRGRGSGQACTVLEEAHNRLDEASEGLLCAVATAAQDLTLTEAGCDAFRERIQALTRDLVGGAVAGDIKPGTVLEGTERSRVAGQTWVVAWPLDALAPSRADKGPRPMWLTLYTPSGQCVTLTPEPGRCLDQARIVSEVASGVRLLVPGTGGEIWTWGVVR